MWRGKHIKSLDIGKSPEWRARLFRAGWSDPRATLRSHNMPTTVRSPHFGIQHLERFGDGLWKTCYRVQNSVSYARGRTYLRKEGTLDILVINDWPGVRSTTPPGAILKDKRVQDTVTVVVPTSADVHTCFHLHQCPTIPQAAMSSCLKPA